MVRSSAVKRAGMAAAGGAVTLLVGLFVIQAIVAEITRSGLESGLTLPTGEIGSAFVMAAAAIVIIVAVTVLALVGDMAGSESRNRRYRR